MDGELQIEGFFSRNLSVKGVHKKWGKTYVPGTRSLGEPQRVLMISESEEVIKGQGWKTP